VNREGVGLVPARREVAVAAGNRERSGRHVLTGCASVIEQDKQNWLSSQLDRRLSQSLCHVRLLIGNLIGAVGMTPRVRGLLANVDHFLPPWLYLRRPPELKELNSVPVARNQRGR
jgi:hypothetical protein